MKADKGNITMNVLFGVFLVVNIIRIYGNIQDRNRRIKEEGKRVERCNCSGNG